MNKQAQKQAGFLDVNQAKAPVGGWGDHHIVGGGNESTVQGNRRQLVGIPLTVFAAGQTKVVECKVTRACKPYRLVIAASIADNYSISNINIKNRDQNLGNGPIPCEAFSQDAQTSDLDFDTVPQGGAVNLTVTAVAAGTFGGVFHAVSEE